MPSDFRPTPSGRTGPRPDRKPDGIGRAHGAALHGPCTRTPAPPSRRRFRRRGSGAMKYTAQERLEAACWFLDIHDVEDPSPEMLQEWGRWMDVSDAHRLAFAAVESAWHQAPATARAFAKGEGGGDDEEYDGSVSIHEWLARRGTGSRNAHRFPRVTSERRRLRFVAVAAAAAMGAAVLVLLPRALDRLSGIAGSTEFVTRMGEHMQVTLADGSQVNLGGRSRLSVAYTPFGRDV